MPDVSWCRRQAVGRPALCLEAVGAEGSGTIGFLREALKGLGFGRPWAMCQRPYPHFLIRRGLIISTEDTSKTRL